MANVDLNRFDDETMKASVKAETYAAFHKAIKDGVKMPEAEAEDLAQSLLNWGLAKGATSFSHVFYPVRGIKAGGKVDAFIDLDFKSDKMLKPIVGNAFDASKLFMSETDGSSFPNGGLRVTHSAAAYMLWDRTSPPYLKGETICIPSAFIAWNGAALDYKTPLLRSQHAVSKEGVKLLHNLGFKEVTQVVANVGWEQEFFLIPADLFQKRPDLMQGGRTVMGQLTSKNQQLSDCYFSALSPKIEAFSNELRQELFKVGVSTSVFHNEVAPSQHELSPIFSLTNVASDSNVLTTEIMHEVAAKHGFAALLHEKPFAGINGSGKHANWGLNADNGMNLYVPGKTPEKQKSFVAFTAALMYGVYHHQEVIRTAVSTHGNDFRLGAQEAPPGIFSMYPGKTLEAHLLKCMDGGPLEGYKGGRYGGKIIETGVPELGPLGAAVEDRNRTAPLPFCGNRWELRAVGSNQVVALPMTAINTLVAEGMSYINGLVEGGKSIDDAVRQTIKENINVIFTGNGYDPAWHKMAVEERGLKNIRTSVEAYKEFKNDATKALFTKHNVLSEEELEAMVNIFQERYVEDVNIEADTMIKMVNQGILPACAADLKSYEGTDLAGDRPAVYKKVASAVAALQAAVSGAPEGVEEAADYAVNTIIPAINDCRDAADDAEGLLAKELYPYPTYYDMLLPHHFPSN